MMTPELFKTIRLRHGLSMDQVAVYIGVTKGAVSRWEAGLRPIPLPVEKLMRLLDEGGESFFEKLCEWG